VALELKSRRVLVVGLGKSGVAAATFLHAQGARVTVSDSKPEAQLGREIPRLLDLGIVIETGGHGERTFRDQDLIVISPGVPVNTPELEQARRIGTRIIGEVELAARFLQGPIVAITGSNGKTTTTSLCGEILSRSAKPVTVGGNIGTPVTEMIRGSSPETWNVLEISSFQLETIESFRPKIAAILNITPDHLDRHGTFEAYVAAKACIFKNQSSRDFAVLNAEDAACREIGNKVKSQLFWFGVKERSTPGAYVRSGQIFFRDAAGERAVMPVSEISLKGAHNVENVLAAVCVGMLARVPADQVRSAVRDFKAVEHRLEHVATINDIAYYNDSKATNVDATIKALESFAGNIHLILGGKDKGSDYTVLNSLLRQRVKQVYTIGAAAHKIESQVTGAPVMSAKTLESAVRAASSAAAPGDIVLLAPACASFDQFDSYEHRGRVFKELVQSLQTVGAHG
jgi:UDP-N-acetylmuramoylalanine--D-glutamate ligase